MQQKYYLGLINEEWRLMIECLNKLRNRLISEGRYTDAVDEVLIKVCHINRAVIFLTTLFLYLGFIIPQDKSFLCDEVT